MIFFSPVYLSTFLFNKLYVVLHHLFYTVALQKTTILLIYRPKKHSESWVNFTVSKMLIKGAAKKDDKQKNPKS